MKNDNQSHTLLTAALLILSAYIFYQLAGMVFGDAEKSVAKSNTTTPPQTIVKKVVVDELAIVQVQEKSGKELFASLGCAGCHGVAGKSTNPMFPVLAGKDSSFLTKQLVDFQSGARPSPMMAGQAAKTKGSEQAIADYLASQK